MIVRSRYLQDRRFRRARKNTLDKHICILMCEAVFLHGVVELFSSAVLPAINLIVTNPWFRSTSTPLTPRTFFIESLIAKAHGGQSIPKTVILICLYWP